GTSAGAGSCSSPSATRSELPSTKNSTSSMSTQFSLAGRFLNAWRSAYTGTAGSLLGALGLQPGRVVVGSIGASVPIVKQIVENPRDAFHDDSKASRFPA